jgi:SAM-dependent methyltransferase
MGGLIRASAAWAEKQSGEIQPVRFVIGFLMAFKRSLSDEIGEFDESLWPCSGEEIDFCFRTVDRGHKIGYCRSVYVHHHGSRTFSEMQRAGLVDYKATCERNDAHLAERWGDGFWHTQIVDVQDEPQGLCLNLGCGDKKLRGYVNIDRRHEVQPDICRDILHGLPYANSTVDRILANDFLEHIPAGRVIEAMNEIWSVLRPGGIFESSTPSTDGRGAFQDPTHLSFWNRNSWLYYSVDEYRAACGIKAKFEIVSIQDIETSRDHRIIHTHVVARAVKP